MWAYPQPALVQPLGSGYPLLSSTCLARQAEGYPLLSLTQKSYSKEIYNSSSNSSTVSKPLFLA